MRRLPAVCRSKCLLIVAFVVVLVASSMIGSVTRTHGASPLASSAPGWFDVSGLPSVSHAELGTPISADTQIAGTLTFPGQAPQEQAAVANAVYNPASPLYHHFFTGNQFDELFAPSTVEQGQLMTYLQGSGVTVSVVSPFFWNVQGSAASMGKAFHTTFANARAANSVGYYPETPLELPSQFAGFVQVGGGLQSLQLPHPADLLKWNPASRAPVQAPPNSPRATLTLNMSMNGPFFMYSSGATYANPPTNFNGTYELNITGGTAPYKISWNWGDGSTKSFTTSNTHFYASHIYFTPPQADYCDTVACWNITVSVTDSASNTGTMVVGLFPGLSAQTAQLFYDVAPLLKLGFSGAGTKIGLSEMCDPSFSNSQYMTDANIFSRWMGLPLFTSTTLKLMGSGASTCLGGSSGWSGETMLDIEWAHVFAPNATLEVDLSTSDPGEGDSTWLTLSNGVYIASNSWGNPAGSYDTTWNQAATQGQSYLTASGDCGSAGLANSYPADIPTGVGVGGTQVYPQPSGVFGKEYAWNGTSQTSCSNNEGSTGGYTTAYTAPTYQQGMTGFGNQDPSGCTSTTCRGVPDISAVGGTWVQLVYNGAWTLSAGTSLACPSSAAMLDLMYQYNGTATKGNGMANYDLYNIAKSANYNIGFHDVTIGNNMVSGSGYNAGVGWDPVTGLGSFNVAQLAQLIASQNSNPSPYSALTVVMAANISYGLPSLAVSLGADVAGGPSSLSGYSYAWTFGDGSSSTTTTNSATHVYTNPGTYLASVAVTSGTSSGTSNSVTIKVAGTPAVGGVSITSFTPSVNPVTVGSLTVFNTVATGGTTPYSYAYSGLPTSCGGGNTASLNCTPTVAGNYTVSVTVTDAASKTASSSTTLTVTPQVSTPPTITSFTATPNPVTAGSATSLTAVVTGGTQPYSYVYTGLPPGCTSASSATISCTSNTAGNYSVGVTVTDAKSASNSSSLVLTVQAAGAPLTLTSFGATPSTITLGGSTTISTAVNGGYPAYTYVYSGLPAGCTSSNTASFVCTPTSSGAFTIGVAVTDTKGTQVSSSTSLIVNSAVAGGPTISSFVASPATLTLGGSTTFTVTVNGGTTPYSYSYTGLPSGCTSANIPSPSCTPTATGSFSVYVTVTDSAGRSTSASTSLVVTGTSGGTIAIASFTITPNSVRVNNSVTVGTQVTGGVQPYSFVYTGLPAGCTTYNQAVFSCIPTTPGQYSIQVTVTDSHGGHAQSSATLTVLSASGTGGGGANNNQTTILGLPLMDWVLVGVVVAVVALAAAAVVIRRKRRARQAEPPVQPWAQAPGAYPNYPPQPPYR